MRVFEPPTAYPTRGLLRIVGGGLLTLLRSLPALLGLAIILLLVSALASMAVAIPAAIGATISPWLAWAAGALMALLALPFLILWDSAGSAAILAMLGARPLGRPLGARAALGVGIRRALPLLGASLLTGLLVALVALPMSFIGLGAWFLWGFGSAGQNPIVLGMAMLLAVLLPFLILLFLSVFTRILFARHVAVFEDLGPLASLERAWELTAGQVPRILVYGLLGLLGFALIAVVASPAAASIGLPVPDYAAAARVFEAGGLWPPADRDAAILLGRALATFLLPGLAASLLGLWMQASSILLYFDIRRRKEGFGHGGGLEPDFQLDLDAPAATPAGAFDGGDSDLLAEVDARNDAPDRDRLPEAWTVEGEALESRELAEGLDMRPAAPDAPPPDRLSVEPEIEAATSEPDAAAPAPVPSPDEGAERPSAPEASASPQDIGIADDAGMGSGGKRLTPSREVDPKMRRLIDMLPESEPEEAPKTPRFLERLLGWLPAPESDAEGADEPDDKAPDDA